MIIISSSSSTTTTTTTTSIVISIIGIISIISPGPVAGQAPQERTVSRAP